MSITVEQIHWLENDNQKTQVSVTLHEDEQYGQKGNAPILDLLFPNPPAVPCKLFGFVCAVEEATLEQLHSHNGEDEHEEHVDDQNVQHILQGVHHAVKHCLQGHTRRRRSCCDVTEVVIILNITIKTLIHLIKPMEN